MKARLFLFIACGLFLTNAFPCFAGYALDMDYACFRMNDTLSYVEIYSSLQRSRLMSRADDSSKADFKIVLEIKEQNTVVLSDTFAETDILQPGEQMKSGQFFPHVFTFVLKPNVYEVRTSLYQYAAEPRDFTIDTMTVETYPAGYMKLSSIEIGSDLSFTKEESRFNKNGVRLFPNPTLLYGTQFPLLCYYAETYGLDFDSSRADSYSVTRKIVHGETLKPVRPDRETVYPLTKSAIVLADGFPVSTLKTGTYYLYLEVKNLRNGQTAHERKKFWIFRPEDYIAGSSMEQENSLPDHRTTTGANILDTIDPDSGLIVMKYILSRDENSRVKRLNAEGKREFLRTYWADREKTEPGAANRYFARVVEAEDRYTLLKKPGWKTDRGRVFILYGEPNQIERNYGIANLPDHELWQYDKLEGGVYFVFMDKNGFGELNLVHSTMRGEIYNPNWKNLSPSSRRDQDTDTSR